MVQQSKMGISLMTPTRNRSNRNIMSLSEEIQKYRKRQVGAHRGVPSNVAEKWDSRILKRIFHILGEKGAEAYLSMFGRGIGEKKVVDFAIKAEIEECQDMADGFWKKAYSIQSSESAA